MTQDLSNRGMRERSTIASSPSGGPCGVEQGAVTTDEVESERPGFATPRATLVGLAALAVPDPAAVNEWAVATRRDDRCGFFIPALQLRPAIAHRQG